MRTIDDILYEVSKKKEFGDIDEVKSLSGSSGFATFVGVFSMDEILDLLKEDLL